MANFPATTNDLVWDDEQAGFVAGSSVDQVVPIHVHIQPKDPKNNSSEVTSITHWVKEDDQTSALDKDAEDRATPMDRIEIRASKNVLPESLKKDTQTSEDEKILDLTGFHLHFLPKVEKFEDGLRDGDYKRKFSEYYMLPASFWDRVLSKSNGFYSRWSPFLSKDEKPDYGHWSMCRFLIKNYQSEDDSFPEQSSPGQDELHNRTESYEWYYITLCSLWFKKKTSTEAPEAYTHIYLCFDVPNKYRKAIVKRCKEAGKELLQGCPFTGYSVIMESVIDFYDDSLWNFRKPVRNIEKARETKKRDFPKTPQRAMTGNLASKSPSTTIESASKADEELNPVQELGFLMSPFQHMAELNRHLIHAQETLAAAINTMDSMAEDHNDHCPLGEKGACLEHAGKSPGSVPMYPLKQMSRSFICHSNLLSNLKYRADAFEKRLSNEIGHAFNLIAVEENFTTKQLLRESRKDERELSTLVSLLTLFFLPGTFISGFFGMSFFDLEDQWKASPKVWIFFVTTVPITIAALGLWMVATDRKVTVQGARNLLTKLRERYRPEKKNPENQTTVVSKGPKIGSPDSNAGKEHIIHRVELTNSSNSSPSGDLEAQLGASRTI